MGLFPFLAPSPSAGAKQEGAPSLEPLRVCRGQAPVCPCWGGLVSDLVAMGLCQDAPCPWQSLAALQSVLRPLLPSLAARGCGLRAALCQLLLQCWSGPPCHSAQHLHPAVPCPSAAAWLPGLPAGCPGSLPSLQRLMLEEEPGGRGSWQGVLRERMARHSSQQDVILSHSQPRGVEFHPLVYSRAEGTVRGSSWGS